MGLTGASQSSPTLGLDIGGTSVKGVLLPPGHSARELRAARSAAYARPGRAELSAAVAEVARKLLRSGEPIAAVGICAPGLRDTAGTIVRAVNVPGLEGISALDLVHDAVLEPLGLSLSAKRGQGAVFEFSDAYAAAFDFLRFHPAPSTPSRLLALSLGTGVGACVLDDVPNAAPRPLIVSGAGPGHIGHVDVSLPDDGPPPLGPDGARGTLESYMGLPALRARFGDSIDSLATSGGLRADRAPLAALVKALRIAHAIYRPHRIALLGGIGLALRPLAASIQSAVADGLTTLAHPGWTLEIGGDDLHAARGAAALALAPRHE